MLKHVIHKWERKLSRVDTNRMLLPFEWGLEFLDRDLRQSDSDAGSARDTLFRFNDSVLADSDSFFSAAPIREYSFDGHWVSFASSVQSPYPENNTAYGRYFPVAKRGDSGRRAAQDEVELAQGRAVIVLPQWNADVDGHVGLCRWLNHDGIAAVRLSLPYHHSRMPSGLKRADYLVSPNVGRTLQACRQAVLDVRGMVDWLIERGYRRIGITGTSIGSCIAFLAMIHDARLKAGAYNHVSSYFGDVVWEGISTAHVRRGLESALTREEVRRAWLAISPNAYIRRFAGDGRAGLFISARYDLSFPPELSQLLFEECDRHGVRYDLRRVPWGHYTMGKTPFKYYDGYMIVSYLRKRI